MDRMKQNAYEALLAFNFACRSPATLARRENETDSEFSHRYFQHCLKKAKSHIARRKK